MTQRIRPADVILMATLSAAVWAPGLAAAAQRQQPAPAVVPKTLNEKNPPVAPAAQPFEDRFVLAHLIFELGDGEVG